MKKYYAFLLLFILNLGVVLGQNHKIDHWEMMFDLDNPAVFTVGNEAPPEHWNQVYFDDATWTSSGMSAVGYGGLWNDLMEYGFPDLALEETTTLYSRTVFNVEDVDAIEELMLDIYFADGYVAYINGVEVARANMGSYGDTTTFDQVADNTHPNQANIYYNVFAPGTLIEKQVLDSCLVTGYNILAIELHNDAVEADVHHYFAWLFAGLNVEEDQYLGKNPYFPIAVNLDSTNLPIVKINTEFDQPVPDEPKLKASMQIIYDSLSSYQFLNDTVYNYNGNIGIEMRGSSSLSFYPKKSFGIETRDDLEENLNVPLLGMPAENDWVLYAPFGDKTLLRNAIAYKLSAEMGHYAPRVQFVELVLNDKLQGVYILTEKIKRDDNRVDISGLRSDEVAGDSLTGGYIIKIDKQYSSSNGWMSEYGSAEKENYKNKFQYVYPKPDEIMEEQKDYIQTFMKQFEESLRADNFSDPTNGYQKYMNTASFIDYLIVNELSKNMDGYRLSTFMYKDRDDKDGRLNMGPVWDYNLAFGNYENFEGALTSGWSLDFGQVGTGDQFQLPFWWDRLLQDPMFVEQLSSRWNALREGLLSESQLFDRIDAMVEYTESARVRNYSVWQGVFEAPIWPNENPFASDYLGEVEYMKTWIGSRLLWIDENIDVVREEKIYVSIENEYFDEYLAVNAYPNPFVEELNIAFNLESNHQVSIVVYNTMGQKVKQIVNAPHSQGSYVYQWNGSSDAGAYLPTGVYAYVLMLDNKPVYSNKILKQ